jgi:hypothetical protein
MLCHPPPLNPPTCSIHFHRHFPLAPCQPLDIKLLFSFRKHFRLHIYAFVDNRQLSTVGTRSNQQRGTAPADLSFLQLEIYLLYGAAENKWAHSNVGLCRSGCGRTCLAQIGLGAAGYRTCRQGPTSNCMKLLLKFIDAGSLVLLWRASVPLL